MKTLLSALGWVPDAPAGNRLRWHYPVQRLVGGGGFLGLPRTMIVERAPVDDRDLFQHRLSSAGYPYSWWTRYGTVGLTGAFPLLTYALPRPAQAVAFTWSGITVRMLFIDADSGRAISEQVVNDTDQVYAEGTEIGSIVALGGWGAMQDFRTLDLFQDPGLPWKPIAELAVEQTFASPLAAVAPRCGVPPAVSEEQWRQLCELAQKARGATPADPRAWDELLVVLGLRWQFALLGGFAFFDGPRGGQGELDHVVGELLQAPPHVPMAYRVRDADNRAGPSSIAVCPPLLAVPLSPPAALHYVAPEVRLIRPHDVPLPAGGAPAGPSRQFVPVTQFEGDYAVQTTMRWQQTDPRALGVELEERVSASPFTGAPSMRHELVCRSRDPQDPPLQGSLRRSFEVSFPDVTLQARARAIDAWDRVSMDSPWTAPAPLALHHQPLAPPLASATHDGATARLERSLGVYGVPDWAPDAFVARVGGHVRIYRQIAQPRTAAAAFSLPVEVAEAIYQSVVTGVAGLADFAGGTLSIGSFRETVLAVVGSAIQFRADKKSFVPGAGRLTQELTHPSLWTQVADFPAQQLPRELVFSDPLPPPDGTAVESYHARVAFYGRLGPAGNIVRALRHPAVLPVPPPFTVELLGIDFYRRTLIKLRFTEPPGPGRFTIWWAGKPVNAAQLARLGAAGEYRAQEAQGGVVLYDVLPLPIPHNVPRTITIGVQRVSGAVQSELISVPVTLAPLGA